MSTAQRVSRGFHRFGFLLATVTFLICGYFMVVTVMDDAGRKQRARQELLCARDKIKASNAEAGLKAVGLTDNLDLKSLGCTSWSRVVSREAVLNVRDEDFSYASALLIPLSLSLPLILALAISFGVYGLMRAIGRVIGGFAAS
jgi:hypothetical protein